jgi:hypothetical protein
VFKATKILLFGLLAVALLAVGCVGAQTLWSATHHRYDTPHSGYYYSSVNARFAGTDNDVYSFSFQGKTEPRWRWVYSTNFVYRSLKFEWLTFDSQAERLEGSGTLRLPSLLYESSRGTGILTRAMLSEWLLGSTNRTPEAARSVDAIFRFLEAAGHGTLPGPNHHGHSFEQPVRGHIQHFRLGFGVGGLVYIWVGVWLLSIVFLGRRLSKGHDGG